MSKIKSISEFLDTVLSVHKGWGKAQGEIWFRGIVREDMQLLPGVKWRGIEDKEDTIVSDFMVHGHSMLEIEPKNGWQWYSLMQHYGLPTRLLDWSKSPLTAVYFALDGNGDTDRVIWCMDPYELNKETANSNHLFVPGEFAHEEDGVNLTNYLPFSLRDDKSAKVPVAPLAIEPAYTNRRILAQKGCFTIHGSKNEPIDTYFRNGIGIKKLVLDKNFVESMRLELKVFGVDIDTIYQDLNSLSKRIISDYS